jgi:hypothetical protein
LREFWLISCPINGTLIPETTVRHHLTSIFGKLGLHDRFNLVFYAYRHGLAVPPR